VLDGTPPQRERHRGAVALVQLAMAQRWEDDRGRRAKSRFSAGADMRECLGLQFGRLLGWTLMWLCLAVPDGYAQATGKAIRVGVLLSGSEAQWSPFENALVEGLRDRGYVEGRNLTLVRRYGELQGARIRSSAAELATMHVDAIVTSCTTTTRVAASAAADTPVVMASIADPVLAGLVTSLARPGGNITGRASMSMELLPKRLEMLRMLLPESARIGARIAVLMNGKDPAHEAQWLHAEAGARALNLNLVRVEANGPAAVDAALEALAQADAKGLLVLSDDPTMIENRFRVAVAATKLGLPSISGPRVFADAGGLMTYGMDIRDDFRLSAAHVVKVANGVNPATLPIEQPTQLQLTINLRTAAALGIKIPSELLLRADATID
jgi:putative ABC transport system substrate-binding protein